jgi:hypothetical protein
MRPYFFETIFSRGFWDMSLLLPLAPPKSSFCVVDLTKKSKQIPLKALFLALDIVKSNSNAFQLSNNIPMLNPGHKKPK